MFAEFSAEVGVANIREFEASSLKQHRAALAESASIAKQIASLNSQIEYIEKRDFKGVLARLQKQLSDAVAESAALEEQEARALAKELQIREHLRAENVRVGEMRAQRTVVLQGSQALQDRRVRRYFISYSCYDSCYVHMKQLNCHTIMLYMIAGMLLFR